MNITLKNQIEKTFSRAISDFKNENEAYSFLRDFLTPKEFETLAKRLAVAYWISKKRTYGNIQNNLKVSSSTISLVSAAMEKEGFKKVMKKIEADEWADKWAGKLTGNPISWFNSKE